MLRKFCAVILCCFAFGIAASAEELTAEKKQVIDELLAVTGAAKIGELMATAMAGQMIIAIAAQSGEEVDPKFVAVVQDELGLIMNEQFVENGWLNEMSYGIYHKHLTLEDLQALVAFYKTPSGRKVVSVLPQITQEGMIAGQQHGDSLGPLIQERLVARLQEEGLM